jgi:predicted enzyme related to lactoylglutathione lyase
MEKKLFQHGMISWSELMTGDVEAAKDFYTRLFGWKLEVPDMEGMEGMEYTLIKANDEEIGGIMATPPQAQGTPPYWGIYVTVDNVDATAEMAEELGGKICVPPRDIPQVGRFCVIQDPQGAYISAITYNAQA